MEVKEGSTTSNFWLLARALGEFVKGEGGGLPPLSGEVTSPHTSDMTEMTEITSEQREGLGHGTAVLGMVYKGTTYCPPCFA